MNRIRINNKIRVLYEEEITELLSKNAFRNNINLSILS